MNFEEGQVFVMIDKKDNAECRIEKYYGKLRDIENGLKNAGVKFYRTHQSFLVNPKYVKKYYYNTMELTDGTVLTISENRRKKVNELYCELKGGDIIV